MTSRNGNRSSRHIAALESLAEDVLTKFPVTTKQIPRGKRPFFIEFSGTPKSGKTTGSTRLDLFLRRNGFSVRTLSERASNSPLRRKTHMFFNIWTTCSTLTQILHAEEQDDQIVLIDRGLFDSLCWMHWMEKAGRLAPEDRKTIDDFILMRPWRSLVDLVILMKVDPAVALEREFAGQLTRREGSIMNKVALAQFNDSLDAVHKTHGRDFKRIDLIETTHMDPIEGVERLTENTLRALDEFLRERVLVIPKSALARIDVTSGYMRDPEMLQRFCEVVEREGSFVDRTTAESSLDLVQPIPVAYFKHQDRFLLLRRKESASRNRLHDKYVIWAGGHVREADSLNGGVIETCLRREIAEELYVENLPIPTLKGLVLDTSNFASSRHVGVIHEVQLKSPDVALAFDQSEFRESRGTSMSGKLVGPEELSRFYAQMEYWSQAILAQLGLGPVPERQEEQLF